MINYLNLDIIEQDKQATLLCGKNLALKKILQFLWHKKILTTSCEFNKQENSSLSFLTKNINDKNLFSLIEKLSQINGIKEILYKRDFQENNNELIILFNHYSDKTFYNVDKAIESSLNFERKSTQLNGLTSVLIENIIKLNKTDCITNIQKQFLNYVLCSLQVEKRVNLFFASYFPNTSLLVNESNFETFSRIINEKTLLEQQSTKFSKHENFSNLIKELQKQLTANI
jgi:hypothetical protein